MRIAIAKAYNGIHRKLSQEFRELGYEVKFFDIDGADWLQKFLKTKADIVVWFADDKHSEYRLILDRLYFLEKYLDKLCFPDLNMYYAFNDKIKQYNILTWLQVPVLPAFVSFDKEKAEKRVEKFTYPAVLKDAHSFGGKGVFKIESSREMKAVAKKIFSSQGYKGIKNHVYLQKYLPNLASDLRVITIGGEIASAYRRSAGAGWKHNLEQGGEVSFENIPRKALDMCLDISGKMGYHWMSYDCFAADGKIFVNEFSCNFGIKGAKIEGRDIRKEQVQYIHSYLNKTRSK
jgi:ribosomal protein S6--L-glutamate ligase